MDGPKGPTVLNCLEIYIQQQTLLVSRRDIIETIQLRTMNVGTGSRISNSTVARGSANLFLREIAINAIQSSKIRSASAKVIGIVLTADLRYYINYDAVELSGRKFSSSCFIGIIYVSWS